MEKPIVLIMSKIESSAIQVFDRPEVEITKYNRRTYRQDRINMQKYHNKMKCGRKVK